MGGPVLAVEVLLGVAFGLLGVEHLDQVPRDLGEVGGVEPARLLEEELLRLLAQVLPVGESVDGVDDDGRLLGRDRPVTQRGVGAGQLADELGGLAHDAVTAAAVGAGQVGEPVGGGAPGQVRLRDLAGLDLGQHGRLDRGQSAAQGLELLDRADQLVGSAGRPEHLVQSSQLRAGIRDHPRGGDG